MANQLAEGIMQFLGFTGVHAWRTQVRTQVWSYDGVGEVVHGVCFSLTTLLELNLVELIVSISNLLIL